MRALANLPYSEELQSDPVTRYSAKTPHPGVHDALT